MPPKKGGKGKKGGKKGGGKKGKKGAKDEELTVEEKYKKSLLEMQNLKHHLSLQTSVTRSVNRLKFI